MKKKIVALILLAVFSVITFAACASDTTPAWQTDKSAPWYNNNRYERIEYDYSRNTAVKIDGKYYTDYTVASGKYITEMIGIKNLNELDALGVNIPAAELSLSQNSNYSYTLLRTSLTVTYNNAADAALRGKQDILSTDLLYYTMDMLPIYLKKSADYGSTGTKYEIATDYINLTNTGYILEDGNRNDFNTAVDKKVSSSVYDSDLIYYAARARTSLAATASFSLSVYSPIDSAKHNKKKTYNMNIIGTGSADLLVDKDDRFIKNCFTRESLPAESNNSSGDFTGYTVPGIYATMSINDTKRGIDTHLFYSDADFNVMGMTMSKVLLYMQKDEYNTRTSAVTYRNIYQISDYSISK